MLALRPKARRIPETMVCAVLLKPAGLVDEMLSSGSSCEVFQAFNTLRKTNMEPEMGPPIESAFSGSRLA